MSGMIARHEACDVTRLLDLVVRIEHCHRLPVKVAGAFGGEDSVHHASGTWQQKCQAYNCRSHDIFSVGGCRRPPFYGVHNPIRCVLSWCSWRPLVVALLTGRRYLDGRRAEWGAEGERPAVVRDMNRA
eukprot:scaffold23765_cov41-Phaeocystis_antarctica.AAC.1